MLLELENGHLRLSYTRPNKAGISGANSLSERFAFASAGLGVLVLVAGCVSADSTANLSNPSGAPVELTSSEFSLDSADGEGAVQQFDNPSENTAANIPLRSPIKPTASVGVATSQDLQNAATPTPNAIALNEGSTETSPTANVIETATTAVAGTTQVAVPTANASSQDATTETVNLQTAALETETATTNDVIENASAIDDASTDQSTQASLATAVETGPETQKKPNFFQRIFKSNNNKGVSSQNRPNTRTNSNTAPRGREGIRIASAHNAPRKTLRAKRQSREIQLVARQRDGSRRSALPGVKSNAEIFGISSSGGASNTNEVSGNTQLASVGGLGRLSPNGLRVQHDKVQVACLKPGVLQILKIVERNYGRKPIITSGYRSPKRNRRAGGARNSQHIFCKAVDIQVEGVSKWDLATYLRSVPGRGGVGTYCRTKSVHVDIGKKRDWHHPCRRSKARKRKKT